MSRANDGEPEAPGGFEPPHGGFADLCLTTWLRRQGEPNLLMYKGFCNAAAVGVWRRNSTWKAVGGAERQGWRVTLYEAPGNTAYVPRIAPSSTRTLYCPARLTSGTHTRISGPSTIEPNTMALAPVAVSV